MIQSIAIAVRKSQFCACKAYFSVTTPMAGNENTSNFYLKKLQSQFLQMCMSFMRLPYTICPMSSNLIKFIDLIVRTETNLKFLYKA